MLEAPIWLGDLLQFATLITSILAIVTFIKGGQQAKLEREKSMNTMVSSISTLADSQKRTDDKVDAAIKDADQEHKELWEAVEGVVKKQTTLCALHSVNHPGQAL